MYFSCNVGFSSLPGKATLPGYLALKLRQNNMDLAEFINSLVFLPSILKDMGFSSIRSQGLTAPPFFVSFLITIFSTFVADRLQQRGYTIMILSTIGGVGYVLLATCESVGVRYFGVFLAAAGVSILLITRHVGQGIYPAS